jgi:ceramide glucosyltransferase
VISLLLLALVVGSLVVCTLTVVAALRYKRLRPGKPTDLPAISILKPLSGVDLGLEQNLRSFFQQKYPEYEILFAVRSADDPAIAVVERVRAVYPSVPSRLIITGDPPYPNAKVFSLDRMLAEAQYDLLVMADSDVRVNPSLLYTIAAEFQDPRVGLVTCPYRAVAGPSFWSRLEAIGLNTEFLAGVLVARMMEGMKFAVGPTIAARRATLNDIGGIDALQDYLAEDFVMGQWAAEAGWGVLLSSYIIEHHIGSQPFGPNLSHRLRWNRSTRRSRRSGYWGRVFTNPLPLAVILVALTPAWWPVLLTTVMFRGAAAWATADYILADPLTSRLRWLIPLEDIASFILWLVGFFGGTILWRGREYELSRDGKFRPV